MVFERLVRPLALVLVVACGGASTSPVGGSSTSTVPPPSAVSASTLPDGRRAPDASEIAHYEFMAGCLAEFGIAAEYDPRSGALSIGVGSDQSEVLEEALQACRRRAGLPVDGPDEAYLRDYYPFLVELYRCLVAEGFPVPELVTEETFVEEGGLWHPYELMYEEAAASGVGISDDLRRAELECPNDPGDPRWADS